jgi:hypothetical protein
MFQEKKVVEGPTETLEEWGYPLAGGFVSWKI